MTVFDELTEESKPPCFSRFCLVNFIICSIQVIYAVFYCIVFGLVHFTVSQLFRISSSSLLLYLLTIWKMHMSTTRQLQKGEGCLHNPANDVQLQYNIWQQTSSNSLVFWIHLLEVCWTFAESCKHPIIYTASCKL